MSKSNDSWLNAHGRLWYDDPWYRAAWIVWPQAIGILAFIVLWAHHDIPWGKPVQGVPDNPVEQIQKPAEQVDALAGCRTGDDNNQRVAACSALIASGKLGGEELARAYHLRGWAYSALKQSDSAMQDYNRAISMLSTEPDFFNDRGVELRDRGDNASALQDFNKSISLKPDYALGYANQGYTYKDLNRPDDALAALSTAIRFDPNLVWAYQTRAFINEEKQNWRALYDDANKLIELAPNDRLGFDFRGHAYFESGQYQGAISDFTKSISLDSNLVYGFRTRGRAYSMLNQFDNAMADYQAALRVDAQDATTLSFVADLKRQRTATGSPPNTPPSNQAPASADNYAEELTDFGVSPQSELKVNVGSQTPLTIPGGRRVTTGEVFKLLDTEAVLIDVLRDNSGGHLTLPGAVYMPGAGDAGSFRDRIQRKLASVLSQLTFKSADRPLVFYCEGARCWESYNAALRAMQLGYRNVLWYRGGLRSWKEANLKMQPAAAVQDLGN
jgi:PQQ-dependent catabolism-associated CXXCW motif protein